MLDTAGLDCPLSSPYLTLLTAYLSCKHSKKLVSEICFVLSSHSITDVVGLSILMVVFIFFCVDLTVTAMRVGFIQFAFEL